MSIEMEGVVRLWGEEGLLWEGIEFDFGGWFGVVLLGSLLNQPTHLFEVRFYY